MSYCHHCGREETHDHCVCLSRNAIPKWHVWIIYVLMMSVPVVVLTLIKQEQSIWDINYLFYGGIVLSALLLLITLANTLFKRPYLALFFGCHQMTTRTIRLGGKYVPLCARCTGIYLGVLLFPIAMYWNVIPLYVYLILGVPMLVDGYLQKRHQLTSTNPRRFITGTLFGGMLITLFTLYHVLIIWTVEWIITWIQN